MLSSPNPTFVVLLAEDLYYDLAPTCPCQWPISCQELRVDSQLGYKTPPRSVEEGPRHRSRHQTGPHSHWRQWGHGMTLRLRLDR